MAGEVALHCSSVEEELVQAVEVLPEGEVHAALAQEGLQVEVVELEEAVEVMALAAKPKEVGVRLLLEGRS